MPMCPKCQRNSLEFSEARKTAWCLYIDCGFSNAVTSYKEYIAKFEESPIVKPEEEKRTTPA